MAARLGILAGGGALPARLIEACRASARPIFVLAFEGAADPATVAAVPHAWVRLGAAGEGLKLLRDNGVEELVLAGAVRRPSLAALRPDWRAARFFARVSLRALGDDGLLRAVIRELEAEGFRVVGVDSVLASGLAPVGPIGRLRPDETAEADIRRGLDVARALGALDIGQAVVVQQGLVLGVEAIEGTDALVVRCGALRREDEGGVLVKTAKPGQERRADLPAIGPDTVRAAAAAGLVGIAVEAGSTVLIDRPGIAEAADAAGLFVVGIAIP
ncbi:MAG TPA: UDP-2,3-diacylglucosamine diphosphatase LpxI [Stellaceae bacterium]|nr:UDP-2,3-diacylglucosamine diphosphatase LpxI [Stellaceae bacterium]